MTCEKKETCYIHFTVIFIERCLYLLLMAYIDLENLSSLTCEKNYISLFFILLQIFFRSVIYDIYDRYELLCVSS